MKKLKVLDLFSGIGGFSLGLERTGGFETVAFCEIDETARKVLNKHWPDTPIAYDVEELCYETCWDGHSRVVGNHLLDRTVFPDDDVLFRSEDVFGYEIDVICGGFPCQDISVAGKGEGLDGKRSGLWTEYKRLIQEVKPRYVIIENVANLRSKGLSAVLKDLGEIGYDAEWHVISARSVGAVHLRERCFIIGYPSSTDPNHLRLWKPFTSEEEKQQWWSEATSGFGSLQKQVLSTEPTVCGGDDGFPIRLDRPRRERIKQLGNSIVPQIAQIIGQSILDYEEDKCS